MANHADQPEVDTMMFDAKKQVRVEDDVAVAAIQLALVLLFQFNQDEIITSAFDAPDLEKQPKQRPSESTK